MKTFVKDPDAVLDYVWDWTDWLGEDTIESFVVTVPEPLALDDKSEVNGIVTAWISGGVVNKAYVGECRIVTVDGRTEDRSAIFTMQER